ncbi:MAG: LmbE family protein [uncultured bacterium]|nr:MAG: LmbE family protein [uncultured bacterium]
MDPSNKRLMAIYAHPDDAEIWSGGTISKWNHLGGISNIVCFSTSPIRNKEARDGAKVLSAEITVINKHPAINTEVIKKVTFVLNKYQPDVVITHCINDSHPEHRNIFEVVSNALIPLKIAKGKPNLLLCSDTYNEVCLNGIFCPNIYIDVSDHMQTKLLAIEKHTSQSTNIWKKIAIDQGNLLGNRLSNVKYAEGFIQIPILGKLANLSLF